MQPSLLYVLATHSLAVVFAVSALAKLIQTSDTALATPESKLHRVTAARWVPWAVLFLSAVLLVPTLAAIHAGVAAVIAIVVVTGQIQRLLHPTTDCDCFGSITPKSRATFALATAGTCLAAAYVIFVALTAPTHIHDFNGPVFGAAILALYLCERMLRFDELTGSGYAPKWNIDHLAGLPGTLLFGRAAGIPVTGDDIRQANKPVLIIYASSHCQDCHRVYAKLSALEAEFSSELEMVVVSQNDKLYAGISNQHIHQLVDSKSTIGRFLGAKARPFALYLNRDLEFQIPPVTGAENITKLFGMLARAMEPEPMDIEAITPSTGSGKSADGSALQPG
jgi:hypothetical protein